MVTPDAVITTAGEVTPSPRPRRGLWHGAAPPSQRRRGLATLMGGACRRLAGSGGTGCVGRGDRAPCDGVGRGRGG